MNSFAGCLAAASLLIPAVLGSLLIGAGLALAACGGALLDILCAAACLGCAGYLLFSLFSVLLSAKNRTD